MTDQEIAELGPAFAQYLSRYRGLFLQDRTLNHFDNYCRGLLSDLPRKSVEPIALASGTAVRTLQEFLVTSVWDHQQMRDRFQRVLAETLQQLPIDDNLGTVGVIDETSSVKKGDKTPGVQRQYLGCAGKIENGIVTVHIAVSRGEFRALLDAELYLPESWSEDRKRCEKASIPSEIGYRSKWRIALDQLIRSSGNGHRFDWLTFDEGYGSKVPFLTTLMMTGQRFVGEVPVNFAVQVGKKTGSKRADEVLSAAAARSGKRFRMARQTLKDQLWRASSHPVPVAGHACLLIVAINEATEEVKYFLTNAVGESLKTLLAVAFCRWTVEHAFRVAKQEAGMMHFEGRSYIGLNRHLILVLLVMGFVANQTHRLRGKKSSDYSGAGLPSPEYPLPDAIAKTKANLRTGLHRRSDPLSSETQSAGYKISPETAA